MNLLCRISSKNIISMCYKIQANNYAAGSKGMTGKGAASKKTVSSRRMLFPVEKDVNKLVTYVCGSNYFKEGEDVKLKPDSEYPNWLWTLPLKPERLEDMDPNTRKYWRRVRKLGLQNNNFQRKYK